MKTNDPHVSPYETITAGSLEEKVESWMQSSDRAWSEVIELKRRIAKAREILTEEALQWMCIEPEVEKDIKRAVEALEGK